MHRNRAIAALIVAAVLTAALGVSGCRQTPADTSGGAIQVPSPMDPANKAREGADDANKAIDENKEDVDENTPSQ